MQSADMASQIKWWSKNEVSTVVQFLNARNVPGQKFIANSWKFTVKISSQCVAKCRELWNERGSTENYENSWSYTTSSTVDNGPMVENVICKQQKGLGWVNCVTQLESATWTTHQLHYQLGFNKVPETLGVSGTKDNRKQKVHCAIILQQYSDSSVLSHMT